MAICTAQAIVKLLFKTTLQKEQLASNLNLKSYRKCPFKMESSHFQSLYILLINLMIMIPILTILMIFSILVTKFQMFHLKMCNCKIKNHKKKLDLYKQILILK